MEGTKQAIKKFPSTLEFLDGIERFSFAAKNAGLTESDITMLSIELNKLLKQLMEDDY